MRLALFEPDIPPNVGTILRLGACMNVAVDIIEPCGFPFSERALRRAAMDYIQHVHFMRHEGWEEFYSAASGRLILLTTQSTTAYTDFAYNASDILLFGSETGGVPEYVHNAASNRLTVPMKEGMRSLNIAVAAAMVLGEALRQTRWSRAYE